MHLPLPQNLPVTVAVIPPTPPDLVLLDALKGYKMFEKVGIPVMGVVENMAMHVCSSAMSCGVVTMTAPVTGIFCESVIH